MNLSKNELSQIDKSIFYGLQKLELLDLSYNKIEKVPNYAFQHLTVLKELNLNYNKISTIEDNSFHGVGLLFKLSLGKNALSEVPKKALQLMRHDNSDHQSLSKLDLSGNNIKKVKEEILMVFFYQKL